jgi:SAM-dependent methyltransferase
MAVPLAELGHHVTVVDPSPDALAGARAARCRGRRAAAGRGVQADTATLADVVPPASIDLVCCHEVLEYVDDPAAAIQAVADVVRPGGAVSLLVAQRSAVVLARAVAGRFAEAARALDDPDGRWGDDDPLPRRYDEASLVELVRAAGLDVELVHGVRGVQ